MGEPGTELRARLLGDKGSQGKTPITGITRLPRCPSLTLTDPCWAWMPQQRRGRGPREPQWARQKRFEQTKPIRKQEAKKKKIRYNARHLGAARQETNKTEREEDKAKTRPYRDAALRDLGRRCWTDWAEWKVVVPEEVACLSSMPR